ncbi:sensor histidine kinase [Nocardioides halotolerans]|jgi:signal transduction histidine kinase|uniref:sensor histidine kinase n=1 Tax=Nocardioides halotolerans TaxID=433660 RepID=UPI0003F7931C|nr:sensor histidine kinase [Nocardioides halotolerans]
MEHARHARLHADRAQLDGLERARLVLVTAGAALLALVTWMVATAVRDELDPRLLGIAFNAATRLGSALFLICGVLLWAYARQHRSDMAARVGVAAVLLGTTGALTAFVRVLQPQQSGSLVGPLAATTVSILAAGVLLPATAPRAPRPLRASHAAVLLVSAIGLLVGLGATQAQRPTLLDGSHTEHALLAALGASAWAALAVLLLTRRESAVTPRGRRHLASLSALLCAGHLLTAVDGESIYLFAVLAVVLRIVAAALLLRATWCSLDERVKAASQSQARLSAALVTAIDAAQDEERSRARITHDARNACAGVRASLEILSDHGEELDPATRARLRQVAMFGVLHLEQVITRADPYARDFAVMEVVRRVVDGRRLLGNEVAVLGSDAVAHGRAHDLATALLNLLVNAERHAPATQVTVDVSVCDDRVRICVADGGPGVPSEHRERIFSAGWRGAASCGQGLGLQTARELMRGQGGDLELVPSAQGAAFVLTLPAAALEPTPEPSRPRPALQVQ